MWILHYAKANFLLSFSIEFAILLFIYIIYIYIKIPEKCLYRLRSIHHRVPLVSFIIFLSLSPIFSLPRVFAARCRHWWSTWSRIRGIQKYQIVLIPTPSLFLFCFLKIVFLSRKSPFVFLSSVANRLPKPNTTRVNWMILFFFQSRQKNIHSERGQSNVESSFFLQFMRRDGKTIVLASPDGANTCLSNRCTSHTW